MDPAKIRFSTAELELVKKTDWILTKNTILEKIKALLGEILSRQQKILLSYSGTIPEEVIPVPGKISKGENYKGLPYLILDHPRFFSRENIFAIRTMFWWGNYFSVTLHLSGQYKNEFEKNIKAGYRSLNHSHYYAISDDQWEHHLNEENYSVVEKLTQETFEKMFNERPFIKITEKIPLEEWENCETLIVQAFEKFLRLLKG
jgi:hypothetical protein